jgi:predicted RND superfamily exporter protein
VKTRELLVNFAINRPKSVVALIVLMTIVLGALMVKVKVDTDPENMLSKDEAVRVFHNAMKKEFSLHDVVVLGVVDEKNPNGVFNPATLKHVEELTDFIINYSDPDHPDRRVISRNLIAPGTVDAIEQAGPGQVSFHWLMQKAPADQQGADRVRDLAMANPLLKGTMVSEDGKALCIYIPISTKDFAYQVRKALQKKIATFNGDEKYYITGLPVANDTFGVEMFVQMAISAPLAMLAIFLLMLLFFRQLRLIIAPMILAMVTVVCTMGLLIGTGNTVHIMSSMIPIFLMPIAVVDSIHILSEFFDSYPEIGDRRKTIEHVMGQLFTPMLYTSLTSAAGFLSLATTPIPPVRVFGLFVGAGILLAWLLTMLFIPAYIMLMKESSLAGFGIARSETTKPQTAMSGLLRWLGGFTYSHAKFIIALTVLASGIAVYGMSKIVINDNPVKWFKKSHDIRIADTVLNRHFGGTYEAYFVLQGAEKKLTKDETVSLLRQKLSSNAAAVDPAVMQQAEAAITTAAASKDGDQFLNAVADAWSRSMDNAADEQYPVWSDLVDLVGRLQNRSQIFKDPAMLNWLVSLQNAMIQSKVVGKTNSVADLVKKVHQELLEGDPAQFNIPDTPEAVAQCLISFQNSHKPDDLYHLVTPDYTSANIWVQLKSGDNKDMEHVEKTVAGFIAANPPPTKLKTNWAGLTYINVVWQNKMVTGMLKSFLSSFAVVLVMMIVLFRSFIWGLLSMIPLTVTIGFIYGIIGLIGKDYDMPVAVLSSLTLGLAVDFAIHFLERSRSVFRKTGSWQATVKNMFEEPARAITRNVIVIAVGFTPLLAAPLVPYQTVGVFLASIMAISGIATMFILPALLTPMKNFIFRRCPVDISIEPAQRQGDLS